MDRTKCDSHRVSVFITHNDQRSSLLQSFHAFTARGESILCIVGKSPNPHWPGSGSCSALEYIHTKLEQHTFHASSPWMRGSSSSSFMCRYPMVFDGHRKTMSGLQNYEPLWCHNLLGHPFGDLVSFSQGICLGARHRYHFADSLSSSSTSAWPLVCCWSVTYLPLPVSPMPWLRGDHGTATSQVWEGSLTVVQDIDTFHFPDGSYGHCMANKHVYYTDVDVLKQPNDWAPCVGEEEM